MYAGISEEQFNLTRFLLLSEIRRTIQSKFLNALLVSPSPEIRIVLSREGVDGM